MAILLGLLFFCSLFSMKWSNLEGKLVLGVTTKKSIFYDAHSKTVMWDRLRM